MIEFYAGTKNKPYHISCGGIVYRVKKGKVEVLLRRNPLSKKAHEIGWHLPKGTRRKYESEKECTLREVLEETGYEVKVGEKVGKLKSKFQRQGVTIDKTTYYFACKPARRISYQPKYHGELRWVSLEKAKKILATFKEFEKEEKIIKRFQEKIAFNSRR